MTHASNPCSGDMAREAVLFLEGIKSDLEKIERNVRVSFIMIQDTNMSLHQRLFGFQLLEHTIKMFWYKLSEATQTSIKCHLETLVIQDNLSETFFKDALRRCVVETMMREWPQKWPNLLHNVLLSSPCNSSVLLVLLRLGEDVGIHLKPLNSSLRRREILNMITSSTGSILSYISSCLQSNDRRINLLALNTLSSYLEWISVESSLLQFLCSILTVDPSNSDSFLLQSKQMSCECMTTIMSRKKLKDEEVTALFTILSDTNLSSIILLSRICQDKIKVKGSFEFLDVGKRVARLLTCVAKFALQHQDSINDSNILPSLTKELFALLSHPNQSLSFSTIEFWKAFLKAPDIPSVAAEDFSRQYFSLLPSLLTKLPQDHDFVLHEFDSFEEYESFFHKEKVELVNILRLMTEIKDELTFDCSLQLLHHLLSTRNLSSSRLEKSTKDWDIMVFILDAVCSRLPNPKKVCIHSYFILYRFYTFFRFCLFLP